MSTEEEAARMGVQTAHQLITRQAEAGMPVDRIRDHHHDVIAGLFADAKTPDGRAFANGYGFTVDSYVAELAAEQEVAEITGKPHPDPHMAANGWQAGARDEEREAG
jgi:hypothetical protein